MGDADQAKATDDVNAPGGEMFRTRLNASYFFLALLLGWALVSGAVAGEAVTWRYLLSKPPVGWIEPGFDDSHWQQGEAGFGTQETPNSRIGTAWTSDSIWLRRSFEIDALPLKPALHLHHDEHATVYLNGQEIAHLKGWTNDYRVVPLDKSVLSSLKIGANVIAVHCRQTSGGQYIDVHFGDADVPPALPTAKLFRSELITEWGAKVTAENAWTEYPRPQLRREAWQNLNGQWDYAVTPDTTHTTPEAWDGSILVPFCLESRLGGVQRLLTPSEALWYRTVFEAPSRKGKRLLLHFEAVDYACQVLVNGQLVGEHRGGNTPFSIDVTDAVKSNANELIVRVEDDTEAYQLRGKQVLQTRNIWYTRVSGIWQTVWLEPVPKHHLADLNITTEPATGTITVRTETNQENAHNSLRMIVKDQGKTVTTVEGPATELSVSIPDAKLWSPESPHLYDLQITLLDAGGQTLDTVDSYAGIRSIGKARGEDGHLRLKLNGETRFHFGPLDQGWWPDGLLTPPSDEAMRFDIEYLKAAGFNTIRKHIKVEPRRYYYHCDRLGMMVWQDQVSAGNGEGWVGLREDFTEAKWPDSEHQQFLLELDRMIDHLESHPSIVMWVPFNESWGQHRTAQVAEWIHQRDPTRLVNAASGGHFVPVGDLADNHHYPHPAFPFDPQRFEGFVKVVGEFGGHGLPVPGHQWDPNRGNWGYGGLPQSEAEYRQRYAESLRRLEALRQQGIAAGIYTQTTDVEGEINGLMSYDRKVLKIPAADLREMREQLLND